ncbi:MAG TPA: RidA family protein [Anaeromyxobacteraceae bacterium]|nr:RidA family protein [Anaeromyxobacteraceae bacterium]
MATSKPAGKTLRHFTGSTWEPKVGYCRALRTGNLVYVSGTAASAPGGGIAAPGDPYGQAKRCLEIIAEALKAVGADVSHVVRTRMFVADASRWEEFGRAHGEVFSAHPPAMAMLEVKFVDPAMLVEIEADAVVPETRRRPARRTARPKARKARRRR